MIYNQQLLKLGSLEGQSWNPQAEEDLHRDVDRMGSKGISSHHTLCTRKNRVFKILRHFVKMYYNLYTYTVGVKKKVLH